MLDPAALDPKIRLKQLEAKTPGQRTDNENLEMAGLQRRFRQEALERFETRVSLLLDEVNDLITQPLNYQQVEETVDNLQIDLTQEVEKVYIDPTEGQMLLLRASGNRVTANAIYRQAQRRYDRLRAVLDRAERLWAGMSPEDTEWKSKALAADVLDPLRAYVDRARAHAAYAEAGFWCLQKLCEEIVQLTTMYDKAAQMGPPVQQ